MPHKKIAARRLQNMQRARVLEHAAAATQHHATRQSPFHEPNRESRVVGKHRARTDHHRIHECPHAMRMLQISLVANPLRLPVAAGDAAIERLGHMRDTKHFPATRSDDATKDHRQYTRALPSIRLSTGRPSGCSTCSGEPFLNVQIVKASPRASRGSEDSSARVAHQQHLIHLLPWHRGNVVARPLTARRSEEKVPMPPQKHEPRLQQS